MPTIERRHYADDTWTDQEAPWGWYHRARALCSDGVVRTCARVSATADTFFSVPAAVKVKGRTVAGYISISTRAGFDTPTDDDPAVVKFHAYTYGKNGGLLP